MQPWSPVLSTRATGSCVLKEGALLCKRKRQEQATPRDDSCAINSHAVHAAATYIGAAATERVGGQGDGLWDDGYGGPRRIWRKARTCPCSFAAVLQRGRAGSPKVSCWHTPDCVSAVSLSAAIDRDHTQCGSALTAVWLGFGLCFFFFPIFSSLSLGVNFAAAAAAAAAASAAVEGRNAATARRLPGVARSPVEVEVLLSRSVVLGAVHVACGSQF